MRNPTRTRNPDFREPDDNLKYYDLYEDWHLIEASFAAQYGIRLRREPDMTWGEFSALLSGLMPETPLGQMVSIRSEQDEEKIKYFTPEQKKIHDDYQKKIMQEHPEIYHEKLSQIEKLFLALGAK